MKTKYALFALCLPIAFTACQNEELVKDYSQELKNRGEIDVVLSASYPTVGNSVDTRMSAGESGNSLSFLWEKGTDKLGAALMDEATQGQVSGANIFNNYPFIAQGSGATSTFASPSSITKGIYLFYNSYKDVVDREALSLSLQAQEYAPQNVKTPAQQMASYMNMVAPMVNLNEGIKLADAAAFNLPLEFVNLYTPVKVPVKFIGAPNGTKLVKISINGSTDFVLGGKINPSVLAGVSNANVLALTDGAIDAKKMEAAKKAIDAIVQAGAASAGIYTTTGEDQVKGAAELFIKDGMALTNGEVQNFWILIPRGQHAQLNVNVETTNGNMVTKVIDVPSSVEGSDVNPQDFTAATRTLSTVELDFGKSGNVEQPYTFTVNNETDWSNYIHYVLNHIESYVGRDITFTIGAGKTVYVTSLPSFGFKMAGGDNKSKLIFGNEDKSAVTMQLDLSGITMGSNVNLEVGEGATATFRKAQKSGTVASLTNNGTLMMNEVGTITALTNNKTVSFNSPSTTVAMAVAKVDNKAGATVNVKGAVSFTAFTNEEKATIKVEKNAKLALPGTANAGTIENKGALTNTDGFTNNGTIDNYGVLTVTTTFTNAGKIIAQNGSESNNTSITNTNGVVEVINPTAYAALTGGKQYTISNGTTTAIVTNRKDYLAAKTANMGITLGGGEWSIVAANPEPTEASRDLKVDEVTTLNLQADLNVKETADLSSGSGVDITVTGTATIKTAATKTLTLKSLTVAKGATATIAKDAVVIIPNQAGTDIDVTVNGTLINNGKLITPKHTSAVTAASAVKKFNITVATDGRLTNNAIIGGELNTLANIVVNGHVANNGTIYGTNNVTNSQSSTKGTLYAFAPIKAEKADLTEFAGAKEIEAAGSAAVTTIPQNTNVKFTVATTSLSLAAGTYGELTFAAGCTMATSEAGAVISKITINESITLTVSGSNAIICKDLVKTGTLTDSGSKLVKLDGTTAWAN